MLKKSFRAYASVFLVCFLAFSAHAALAEVKDSPIAVVLGKEIDATKAKRLNRSIFGPLFLKFAKDNQIEAKEEEIIAFTKRTEAMRVESQTRFVKDRDQLEKDLKSTTLSAEERQAKQSQFDMLDNILKRDQEAQKAMTAEQLMPMQRQMAQRFIKTWKTNQALYKKYGGRVIFQQAGAEPIDAYRDFLKEEEQKGSFEIFDKKQETDFWKYYTDDSKNIFASKEEADKLINTPFWEMPVEELLASPN